MINCVNCNAQIVWHPGNGGQWIGAAPPRDWMTCYGNPDGPKHYLRIPPMSKPHLVDLWLLDRPWWMHQLGFIIAA